MLPPLGELGSWFGGGGGIFGERGGGLGRGGGEGICVG